jgi:tRNA 5-methylaminomethyl-2-thiouridine biosynthesis bifunctional protein
MSMSQVDKRPSIAIIGAGIAGCSLAYELSKYACEVTLIDAKEIGSGASSVPLALLNPHRGRTARASELDKAGLAAMWGLKKELRNLGLEPGLHQTGVLRIASSERQAELWKDLEGVRWLELHEIPSSYHAPFGGFLVEQGGYVEPRKLLTALVSVAKDRGVKVLEQFVVENVIAQDSRFKIFTQNPLPKTLYPDVVVLCPGTSKAFTANLGLEYQAGDVIGLESDATLPYPIAGAIYGSSLGGVVYMGGNHRDEDNNDDYHLMQLQKSSSWFIPALKDAKRISNWSGVRAKQENNEPIVREVEPNLFFFGALGGRGFLCAYHLANQLAESLIRESQKRFPLLDGRGLG